MIRTDQLKRIEVCDDILVGHSSHAPLRSLGEFA